MLDLGHSAVSSCGFNTLPLTLQIRIASYCGSDIPQLLLVSKAINKMAECKSSWESYSGIKMELGQNPKKAAIKHRALALRNKCRDLFDDSDFLQNEEFLKLSYTRQIETLKKRLESMPHKPTFKFNALPKDIGVCILMYCAKDLSALMQVSKYMYSLANDKRVWHSYSQMIDLPGRTPKETALIHRAVTLKRFCLALPGGKDLVDEEELATLSYADQVVWLKNKLKKDRQIQSVTVLALRGLQEIPPEIKVFTNLKILNVAYNSLHDLPEQVGHLTELTKLHAEKNRLTALPSSIGSLRHLVIINVKYNELKDIPENLKKCANIALIITDISSGTDKALPFPSDGS